MRIVVVNRYKCAPDKCDFLCARLCPINKQNKDCITKGEDKKAKISEQLCVDCGICVKRCPFGAIKIVNLPEKLDAEPIYRYGHNKFELFRIPIPQKNQVVGILGANGIGKTTAMEILAGLKKPNFGYLDKELDKKAIVTFFRGTELQNFFSQLLDKKIRISYKPQYVDMIPKQFKGTARQLLETVLKDENRITELAEVMGISDILDRDLKALSGGELQKVAISGAILKEADMYLFDEPSSYLDIKERIRISSIIRKLAQTKTVLVIEHDLIILDFLSDIIHIMYGEEGVYGVVSHPLSSKNGVNTYLDGYLKDENMKFRESIVFDTSFARDVGGHELARWPVLKVKLNSFSLDIRQSHINRGEVIGVIGANAIGKTTFAKIISGNMESELRNNPEFKELAISYKPQYISADEEINVRIYLLNASKNALSQENTLNVLRPLAIEPLMTKNINELSGGELQRVMLASCLVKEANLYVIDEPSTYLDVEQRLAATNAITRTIKSRESAAALVIDHDLLFISYLADRVLVFSGEPAKEGLAREIMPVKEGMNRFLKELDITLRREPETHRPRVNKLGSVKDKEQRTSGEYYAV